MISNILARNVIVRAVNILGTYHAGIISNREFVIGNEEIVIAIMIDNFRRFACLPTVSKLTSIDKLTVRSLIFLASWIA